MVISVRIGCSGCPSQVPCSQSATLRVGSPPLRTALWTASDARMPTLWTLGISSRERSTFFTNGLMRAAARQPSDQPARRLSLPRPPARPRSPSYTPAGPTVSSPADSMRTSISEPFHSSRQISRTPPELPLSHSNSLSAHASPATMPQAVVPFVSELFVDQSSQVAVPGALKAREPIHVTGVDGLWLPLG